MLIFAFMTLLAIAFVLIPLTRHHPVQASAADGPGLLRRQVEEIEADHQRGLLSTSAYDSARLELGRRLLAMQAAPRTLATVQESAMVRRAVVVAAFVLLPLIAGGIYSRLGSPTLPDQPLAQRVVSGLMMLVAQAESHLATHPDDGRGWEVLAPVYQRMGQYDKASAAWRRSLALQGESAARLSGLAESLTLKASGQVPAEARELFRKALAYDPQDARAQFYLGQTP